MADGLERDNGPGGGDSPSHGGGLKIGKGGKKIALPMFLVIGLVVGVVVIFIAKRQNGSSAVPTYSGQSANQSASDVYGYLGGIQSAVGNLGQQMNTEQAALSTQLGSAQDYLNKMPKVQPDPGSNLQYGDQWHHVFVDQAGHLFNEFWTGRSMENVDLTAKLGLPLFIPNSHVNLMNYNGQFDIVGNTQTGTQQHLWYKGGNWGKEVLPGRSGVNWPPVVASSSGPTATA